MTRYVISNVEQISRSVIWCAYCQCGEDEAISVTYFSVNIYS